MAAASATIAKNITKNETNDINFLDHQQTIISLFFVDEMFTAIMGVPF
jgi:hypothetical protein